MSVLKFREITAADMQALFHVGPGTRENAMTLDELQRLGINPRSVTESLTKSTKGWLCENAGQVVAFSMADRATGEFLVIAVIPEYEGKGIGGRLMALTKDGSRHRAACESGSRRIRYLASRLRLLSQTGAGPTGRSNEACGGWRSI